MGIFKHCAKIVNGKTFFKAKDNLLTKLFFRCHDRGKTKEKQRVNGWLAANGFVGSMVVLLHLSSADVVYEKGT